MQIDQYKSIDYKVIDDTEYNDDLTFYGRLLYSSVINKNSLLKFVASGLSSTHIQKFLSSALLETDYSQRTFSIGTEYEYLKGGLFSMVGISLDGQSTPQTGTFSSKKGLLDFGTNFSAQFNISHAFSTQLSLGRKTRFPTLREMFSGALGKFIPNPDLKSEVSYSAEFGLNYSWKNSTSKVNFFLSFVNDGIVRSTVSDTSFMRINKDKIRNYGIEFSNKLNVSENIKINLNLAYLNSFAKNQNGKFVDTLEYKPKYIFNGDINYRILKNIETTLEANFIGEEYALKDGTEGFKMLDNYLLINFKILYEFPISKNGNVAIFIRANNIFDKLYYTQWGLPEAGRQFVIGTTFNF